MNELKNDKNLRQAVSRREQKLPPMPADLNERLMQRIEETEHAQAEVRPKRLWLYAAIVVAACIALLLIINYGKNPTSQDPLMAQTFEKPLVTDPEPVEEPSPTVPELVEGPLVTVSEPVEEPVERHPAKKHRKAVMKLVELIPTSEANPLLAAAPEPASEPTPAYDTTEEDPLVAMAAQVEDIRQRGQRLQQEITALMNN
jgi:hypothetical protein